MIRTQIQLTEKQSAMLREVAAREHLSMAEIIRRGLDQFLQDTLIPDPEARKQRALAAAGRFHSGHADTSEEHDRVLAEAYES